MRRFLLLLGAVGVLICGAEFGARYWLGLGTPPLSVTHPSIEYMFAPNQDVLRFGNRQLYNKYGMRSVALDEITQSHRVIVFGDSVLNGGNQTDHDGLATTRATDGGTFYGNVSAGSWGPANIVAWIEEYGLIGAETAVIVISTHDLHDVPSFAPLNPQTHSTEPPVSALVEGMQRYVPRYLPWLSLGRGSDRPEPEQAQVSAAGSISAFIDRIASADVRLCAIQHKTRQELGQPPTTDAQTIKALFDARDVPVLDFGPALQQTEKSPYRDGIHINEFGQQLLSDYLRTCSDVARVPR